MRGIGLHKPLPMAPAAMPNYVDHFICSACAEWVYADDTRPCSERIWLLNQLVPAGSALARNACTHHKPEGYVGPCKPCQSP